MKNKIIAGLSLFIFFVFTTTLFTMGLIASGKKKDSVLKKDGLSAFGNLNTSDSGVGDEILSEEVVSRHKTENDCWIIVSGNVYDISTFVSKHPGGSFLVGKYCGGEATNAFNTRDKSPAESHSKFAQDLLRSYYLGPIGKMPVATVSPSTPVPVIVLPSSKPFITTGLSPAQLTIDANEVARHNTMQNCWMILSGKVYDFTTFISQHPGGAAGISAYCGKDGTNAYKTKGGKGSDHSAYAYGLLGNYLIANLGASVSVVKTPVPVAVSATPVSSPSNSGTNIGSNLTLTSQEIATHNTTQNCWIIISNKVYDVTSYLSQHPGGVGVISAYCGKDATTAFQTKGGKGSSHSASANNLLANYLVGSVGSSVVVDSASGSNNGGGSGTSSGCQSGVPESVCAKYSGSTVTLKKGKYEDDGRWEGQVYVNGSCRSIKLNSSGNILSDSSC